MSQDTNSNSCLSKMLIAEAIHEPEPLVNNCLNEMLIGKDLEALAQIELFSYCNFM